MHWFDQRIVTSFMERWGLEDSADYGIGRATGQDLRGNYFELIADNPWGMGLGQKSGVAEFKAMESGSDLVNYDDAATRGIVEAGALGFLAEAVLQVLAVILLVRGLLSKLYQTRLCSAIIGALGFYWIFSCNWHDHNTTAMCGLLLAVWIAVCSNSFIRRSVSAAEFTSCRQPMLTEA